MIRINLLKKNASKKNAPKKAIPFRKIGVVFAVVLLVGCLSGAVYYFAVINKSALNNLIVKIVKKEAPVAVAPVAAPRYNPLPPVKSNIVEDVVKEVDESKEKPGSRGVLDITYLEMSFAEKINYEVLFGKNVFEILSRAVPVGVRLKSLELDNFQTVYAVGLGDTKELISSTFNSLRQGKFELLPQPYSYIKTNGVRGYRFVLTCNANLGLDLGDPFQATDYLLTNDDLPTTIVKISKIAQADGFKLNSEPQKLSGEKTEGFSRYVYSFNGSSTYRDFVGFLQHLYREHVPCALKKVEMKAAGGQTIEITAQFLFTTRE